MKGGGIVLLRRSRQGLLPMVLHVRIAAPVPQYVGWLLRAITVHEDIILLGDVDHRQEVLCLLVSPA